MYSRPRFNRGTSVIAALVFAALLGAVALGLHAFQNNSANTAALPAEASTSQTPTEGNKQTCPQVIATANASNQQTPPSVIVDKSQNLTDSCNAAASTGSLSTGSSMPTQASSYTCVGKSGKITDSGNGYFTEDLHTDPTVKAGTCSVQTCDSSGKCSDATPLPGINSSTLISSTVGGNPTITAMPEMLQSTCSASQGTITCPGQTAQGVQNMLPPGSGYNCADFDGSAVCTNQAVQGTLASSPSNAPTATGCQSDACASLSNPDTASTDARSGQVINCDTNSTQCSTTAQSDPTDLNTYCYDNNTKCYPPDGAKTMPGYSCELGTGPDTGVTVCTSSPSNGLTGPQSSGAKTQNQNNQTPGGQTPNNQNSGLKAPTFTNPQTQGGTQQNNCSIISSLIGGCTANNGLSCQLTVSPNPPQQGMPANLTWTSSGNAYMAQISGVGNVGPSGSYTVYPTGATNYTMTVYGQNNSGQATCNATVNSSAQTGCTGSSSCQSAQTPYGVGTNGQACSPPPPQPNPTQCTSGSWQPVSAANNGCITSYQCGGQAAGQPTAQLSCSTQVADVGMSVAISYSCANATGSSASGFTTGNQTSGSTTTVITAPPSGTNTANFGLTCTNGAQANGAQCSVQINQAAIVLVANPQAVPSGQTSSIGWVTAGMQACVISSPDDSSFTTTNAGNLSVNGVAQTDAITGDTEFDLTCTTLGGLTKTASTIVSVGTATSTTP